MAKARDNLKPDPAAVASAGEIDAYNELVMEYLQQRKSPAGLANITTKLRRWIAANQATSSQTEEGRSRLAACHDLLGHCLRESGTSPEALECYSEASRLEPLNLHYRASLVGQLLRLDREAEAADEVNAINVSLLRSELDSVAVAILNWALLHPTFAAQLSGKIVKECLVLCSKHRPLNATGKVAGVYAIGTRGETA